MTTEANGRDDDREALYAILERFTEECQQPRLADVRALQARHPEFADEILEYAGLGARAEILQMTEGEPVLDPRDEAMVAKLVREYVDGRRARDALTVADLIREDGRTAARIEVDADLPTDFLLLLVEGGVAPPLGPAMVDALAGAFGLSHGQVESAADGSHRFPSVGFSSAASRPSRRVRSYAEVVASSDLSADRKAFWLRGT